MKNQENARSGKSSSWILIPVILIAAFGAGVFALIRAKNKMSSSNESVQTKNKLLYVNELIELLGHDNDFIAQKFNERGYWRQSSNCYLIDGKVYDGQNFYKVYLSDNNNMIIYKLSSKNTYDSLVEDLSNGGFSELPQDKRLADYKERKNFYKDETVVIDYGYEGDTRSYCLILAKHKNNTEEEQVKPESSCLYVGAEGAKCYNTPHDYDRGVTLLKPGTKVQIHNTDGEFIFCDYTTDAGLTISKWLLITDLVKDAPATENKPEQEKSMTEQTNNSEN